MTTTLRPAPSPHTTDRDGRAGRPLVHAENPDQPGYALCGLRLRSGSVSPVGRCVVCDDLTRPAFWVR